jgi:hypothetical protein
MKRLKPEKLQVTYLAGTDPENLILPRRYTLTHSDITGRLFLSIGKDYNTKQFANFYTRLMRDEVLAELCQEGDNLLFRAYCHVSGGFVFGTARLRYNIFRRELQLVLEAIRYGDRTLFEKNPELDNTTVLIHFKSTVKRFDQIEKWGTMADYR